MAYDIFTKTETGRDWGISIPPSNAGSWLADKISGLPTWKKVALVGGSAIGVSLLLGWLIKSEQDGYTRKAHSAGGFDALRERHRHLTLPLPTPHESMREIVHQRLR
jgi:hypothetical protein